MATAFFSSLAALFIYIFSLPQNLIRLIPNHSLMTFSEILLRRDRRKFVNFLSWRQIVFCFEKFVKNYTLPRHILINRLCKLSIMCEKSQASWDTPKIRQRNIHNNCSNLFSFCFLIHFAINNNSNNNVEQKQSSEEKYPQLSLCDLDDHKTRNK